MARRNREANAPSQPTGGDRRQPAPKGRPTPGRRQRAEQARRRARRRRIQVWFWWSLLIVVVLGSVIFFAVTGIGQSTPTGF
ncbi:MAG: hypothetical protein ACLFRD_00290 [Nitriliruptoraceae bacterium]